MNDAAARRALGDEIARLFRGQVADMRLAMFLGELPEEPQVMSGEGGVTLYYPLGEFAILEIEPIGIGQVSADNWRHVQRVKLVRVQNDTTVLL